MKKKRTWPNCVFFLNAARAEENSNIAAKGQEWPQGTKSEPEWPPMDPEEQAKSEDALPNSTYYLDGWRTPHKPPAFWQRFYTLAHKHANGCRGNRKSRILAQALVPKFGKTQVAAAQLMKHPTNIARKASKSHTFSI